MLIVLKTDSSENEIAEVCGRARALGYRAHLIKAGLRTLVDAHGDGADTSRLDSLATLDCVETIAASPDPYVLASRAVARGGTVVDASGVRIGGGRIVVMAGPCSVEGRDQLLDVARHAKAAGATVLRGGAFKPRTSPYSFQGLEEQGLKLLAEVKRETALPIITEVMEPGKVDRVAEVADILQIGARNVQNFPLLRQVARVHRPVLLKRGFATTIAEWLLSAEYILSGGNPDVILCERGIRTFESATRFTLDLNVVPVVKRLSHLPIVVDPSHGTGHWAYVEPMALAGLAAGADGLLIEVHPNPAQALSDGPQSLRPERFARLMDRVRALAHALGREV